LIHSSAIEIARSHPHAVVALLHPGTVATGFGSAYIGNRPTVTSQVAGANLLSVLGALTPADTGGFYDWEGKCISW
jgi:hypothetical protein